MNLWIINVSTSFFLLLVPLYVSVAFLTLLERKILGFSQLRLGPNKSSIYGVLQPFRDAIKLFLKTTSINFNSNKVLFLAAPILIFFLISIIWIVLPHKYAAIWIFSFIILIAILSVGVYPVLWCGWASNSNYAILGAIRGVAQTISYEISFALLLISIIVLVNSISLINSTQSLYPFIIISPFLVALITVRFIAETNRTPFDFAEGESELVSGFNIEYGSIGFVLIFLSEYASIIIVSTFIIITRIRASMFSLIALAVTILYLWLWIQVRSTFPRHRYDFLINIAWKRFLPTSLIIIVVNYAMLIVYKYCIDFWSQFILIKFKCL